MGDFYSVCCFYIGIFCFQGLPFEWEVGLDDTSMYFSKLNSVIQFGHTKNFMLVQQSTVVFLDP